MASSLYVLVGRTFRSPMTPRMQNTSVKMSPLDKETPPPFLMAPAFQPRFLFLYYEGHLKPGLLNWTRTTTFLPVFSPPHADISSRSACPAVSDAKPSHPTSPLPAVTVPVTRAGSSPHTPPAAENPWDCSFLCLWCFPGRAALQLKEMLQ